MIQQEPWETVVRVPALLGAIPGEVAELCSQEVPG